jgi:hypothetical protein
MDPWSGYRLINKNISQDKLNSTLCRYILKKKNLKIFIWKLKINMDDSHEVIINPTPSRDIEGDQDNSLPLNDSFIE